MLPTKFAQIKFVIDAQCSRQCGWAKVEGGKNSWLRTKTNVAGAMCTSQPICGEDHEKIN